MWADPDQWVARTSYGFDTQDELSRDLEFYVEPTPPARTLTLNGQPLTLNGSYLVLGA